MKISIVTPAPPESRAGNRTTALRWAGLLRDLGHEVAVATEYSDEPVDAMVSIHAWRSAAAIARFRTLHPSRPLAVLLAGTDLYGFLQSDRETVIASLDRADVVIGLHDLVGDALPARIRDKLVIVYQSALPPTAPPEALSDRFEVLVVGHLRDVKDPLRAAAAARLLPPASRIVVEHLGRAHDAAWAARAEAEMAANPRYRWRGEVDGDAVRFRLARARLMVLSSIMEGGANVVSEAIVAGTPVLASAIPGSIGLLGRDYAGYFPTGDTAALAALLRRAEADPAFLAGLRAQGAARAPLFTPEREREGLRRALAFASRGPMAAPRAVGSGANRR